jgi:hypothetical protein
VVNHRLGRIGLAAGLLYLLAVGLTLGVRDTAIRPLFDGFAPAPKYRWVAPPPGFAPGNETPESVRASIALGTRGSRRAGIATGDGQLVLALGPAAIAPHGDDRRVIARVDPLDASALRQLPFRFRPNGNAYRVRMTYEPSGVAVRTLARPGTLTLSVPELSRGVFRARADGWDSLPSRGVPPTLTTLTAAFDRPGVYVSATDLPLPPGPDSTTRDHTVLIAVGVGALALLLIAGAFVIARRSRRRTA